MPETSPIDLTEPVWMQQPGESTRWYDRFHRYMLAGPKRSLLGCVRAEGAEQGRKGQTKKTPRSWNVAFAKFCWKDRANAWDNHQHSIDREHWDRRYRDLREAAWEMSQKLLDRHNKMLQSPMFEQEVTATNSIGQPTAVTVSPARWVYRDIIATAHAAIELGAFAIGDVQAAEQLLDQMGYIVSLPEAAESELSESELIN